MHLALSITDKCNLDCAYCYVDQSDTVVKPTDIRRELNLSVPEECRELSLLLFGGEPTLNLPAFDVGIDYLRERGIRSYIFTISNGTAELDVYKRLIDEGVYVFLSVDTFKPFEDRVRRTVNGQKKPNVEEVVGYFADCKQPFKIRATIHKGNVNYLAGLIGYWADKGVLYVHFEPVSPVKRGLRVEPPTAKEYITAVKAAVEEADKRGIYVVTSPFMNLLTPGTHFCKSLSEGQYMLGLDGTVTSCLRVQKRSEDPGGFVIGTVEGEANGFTFAAEGLQNRWSDVDDRAKCRDCSVRYFCGGGCPYRNLLTTGDINIPDPWLCAVKKVLIPFGLAKLKEALEETRSSAVLGNYYLEHEISLKPTVGTADNETTAFDKLLSSLPEIPDKPDVFAAALQESDWAGPKEIVRRTEGCF